MVGGWLGVPTMILAVVLAVSWPSLTVKVTLYAPAWVAVGTQMKVREIGLNVARDGRFAAENVTGFPSGSDPLTVNRSCFPGSTVWPVMGTITGGLLAAAGLTIIVATVPAASCPSLMVKVTLKVPDWLGRGTQRKVLEAGSKLAFAGSPDAEYVTGFPSGSDPLTVNRSCFPVSTVCAGIGAITGGLLTTAGVTTIVATVLAVS